MKKKNVLTERYTICCGVIADLMLSCPQYAKLAWTVMYVYVIHLNISLDRC